ncbi:PREDICTED: uncharacterized protein LOC104606492 [Nelumbo nucifera]|uniref:Uncharacterized protein LOC104606492 n=1 Tax=Nelumbo nucifera TaxID=4432 RepID=A0A1U8AQB4_NELNU|nr:PREDICTED: uncharacterized protein LOC104606492 [Nelumbo nucifera]
MTFIISTKGSKSMADYLQQVKGYTDALEATGQGLSSNDIILYTTGGLGPDYDPLITAITTKHDPLSLEELHSLLHQFELCLNRQHSTLTDTQLSSNSVVHKPGARPPNSHRGGRGGRGKGRYNNTTPSQPKVTCQVYDKVGHSALSCFHRFDLSFQASRGNPPSKVPVASNTLESSDGDWYPNTGATNHLTVDLGNLSLRSNYNGNDKIAVGNGTCLDIKHIGHNSLHTSSCILHLKNILHVPDITKNLISVR